MAAYRWREMQRARGVEFDIDKLDPTPAREAIAAAKVRGLSYAEIARMCEMTRASIQKIVHGDTKTILRANHKRIMRALGDEDNRAMADGTRVDPTWSRRMVYALMAQGWSRPHLQEILQKNKGVNGGFLYSLTTTKPVAYTYEGNRKLILWLVSAIGDLSGPNQQLAVQMQKRGYFPVKHYDYQGRVIVRTLSPEQKAMYESV